MKDEIQKILNIIKPVWIRSGGWTDTDMEQLKAFGFSNIECSQYDGKILKCSYNDIVCHFTKYFADYHFYFKNLIAVSIHEDYTYVGSDIVYNESDQVEDFVNNTEKTINPFTITTCFDVKNKITIYKIDT